MTQHLHSTFVEGCYRCDLNRDEVTADVTVTEKMARAMSALRGSEVIWQQDLRRATAALAALADPDVQAGIAGAMQRAMHDIGLVLLDAEADRLAAAAVERLRGEKA